MEPSADVRASRDEVRASPNARAALGASGRRPRDRLAAPRSIARTAPARVVNCPACDAARAWRLARIPAATVRSCRGCGLVFCDPLPVIAAQSSGDISILTEQSYTKASVARAHTRRAAYARLARERHACFAADLRQSKFRMLEIGCGVAGLAEELVRLGVDYHGIDIDPRVCQVAIERGIGDVRNVDVM